MRKKLYGARKPIRFLPAWARHSYSGDFQDFAEWFERAFLDSLWSGKLRQKIDGVALEQVRALAKEYSMRRVMEMRDLAERTFMYQIYKAEEEHWFRHLPAEMDTVEELLASMADGAEKGSTEWYNMSYFAKTAVPLMKASGVDPQDVWAIPFLAGKASRVVPGLRQLLACPVCGATDNWSGTTCVNGHSISTLPAEQVIAAAELTRKIADRNYSSNDLEAESRRIRGIVTEAPPMIPEAAIYRMPKQTMVVFYVDDPRQLKAIKIATEKMVQGGLSERDFKILALQIRDVLLGTKLERETGGLTTIIGAKYDYFERVEGEASNIEF